jgi:hypothetical protein
LLTLPEAQALTGLSMEFLRDAINEGTQKAKMIGRAVGGLSVLTSMSLLRGCFKFRQKLFKN